MDNQWVVEMRSSCGKSYYLCYDPRRAIHAQNFEGHYNLNGILDRCTKYNSVEDAEAFVKACGGPWSGGKLLIVPLSEAQSNYAAEIARRTRDEMQRAIHEEDMRLNPGLFEIRDVAGGQIVQRRFRLGIPKE